MKHLTVIRPAFATAILILISWSLSAAVSEHGAAAPEQLDGLGSDGVPSVCRAHPVSHEAMLLLLGRSVYADLQRARRAALEKQAAALRTAIDDARARLQRWPRPAAVLALNAQLRVIRNELRDHRAAYGGDLWVPVEAEINHVLVYAPDDVKAQAAAAVRKGKAAAQAGDRARAYEQLDVITSALQYGLGMFPLHQVEGDLDSARASANLSEPNWAGALEAVQSALATFHWYTRTPAHGLLAAYDDVVSAYVLATGPHFRPDQARQVRHYLARAQRVLAGSPAGGPLAGRAKALIGQGRPSGGAIKRLLYDIQSEIRSERQRAAGRYRDAIGSG